MAIEKISSPSLQQLKIFSHQICCNKKKFVVASFTMAKMNLVLVPHKLTSSNPRVPLT
jgi:hypothetical protein